jgi:hypothetical protein
MLAVGPLPPPGWPTVTDAWLETGLVQEFLVPWAWYEKVVGGLLPAFWAT